MEETNASSVGGATSEAWKAFGSDTEAGRLLKKLYCGNAKPKIAYPKPKVKARDAMVPFIPGGGVFGVQSRTHQHAAKVSERAIKAPSFSQYKGDRPEIHPIDYMAGRRKPYAQIEKEINEIKRQMDAYRSSCVRKKPNQEKEKLQQVFSYTVGSILPHELLPGSDLLGRELSHERALRSGKHGKSRFEQLDELYEAVLQEVENRKAYAAEMLALGRPDRAEAVEREILERFSELRRIHELMQREKGGSNNQ